MKRLYLISLLIISVLVWGCSKDDIRNRDLKSSLEKSVSDINTAISKISTSKGFEMLGANIGTLKSETEFNDSISLDLVAGIYDFKPDLYHHHNYFIPFRLFKKTGESDNMVVNLPQKLVYHPRYLHNLYAPDSLLKNNFTITATDYHYYYTWFNKFDYALSAGFTLDSEDLGEMEVKSSGERESGRSYSSKYTFVEGYNVSVSYQRGDTSISTFALAEGEDTLMKETVIRIGHDFHKREKLYILTLGNVEIRRGTGIDSIQVYLDGVLQATAGARIEDEEEEGSVCHHRDILLTFDDGTTANLSDLIQPAREVLKTLSDSLHSMNFSKNIVDYIAFSIYYHSQH